MGCGNRLVVAGGVDRKQLCLRAAEVLEMHHNTFWKEIGAMAQARSMVRCGSRLEA